MNDLQCTMEEVAEECMAYQAPVDAFLTLGSWEIFNPLRAKFFRWNINIYLHFVSFLHIDTTQVLEILLQVRPGPTYST